MDLSNDLISKFVKITNDADKQKSKEGTVYGTAVKYDGGIYVKIDGSDLLTPVDTTADTQDGERVTITIKDHNATVTGNITSPSANEGTVTKKVTEAVDGIEDKVITEVETLVADRVSTKELDAEVARIDELIAGKATIEDLEVTNATIENLKVKDAEIENLVAKKATIDDLTATNATIENLSSVYANIDFANIGELAVEKLFAESGIIGDLIMKDGAVTGTLVGVKIVGDLIEGNTIVAEKLVIKGDDGLFYKLNTDGMKVSAEQTNYNSLNGTIITAKSVTAEKINVSDLVAFDATIGGFKIGTDKIYSGVKSSVDNTTSGIYLDNTGQIAFGDANNYIKYYKTSDGSYSLKISALDNIMLNSAHIDLHGYVTANGGFSIDTKGDITASNATIAGNVTATTGKIANFTISGNDLVGSNVGMGGASGTNYAFWAGGDTSSSAPFRVGHDGSLTATKADITGTINATAGTFSGNIVTNNIVKAYNSVYAGAEIWGGYKLDSSGSYVSSQTFKIHGSAAVQIDGNPTRITSSNGEVKIGDASSYDNLRAREIYAQEIVYTNELRTRDATQLSLSNVSMRSENSFIEFSSGYGVIRVPDVNHLYLQTGGGAANTSSEVRCTAYKDATIYVNLRAHNVCAQNAVYANGVNVSSDRARKRDIELYSTDALHEVCTTPVYAYHLDTDKDEELKRIGIIMQEAPLDAIDLTGKGVDLYQMVTMLWRAVQQQQEIINELKGE